MATKAKPRPQVTASIFRGEGRNRGRWKVVGRAGRHYGTYRSEALAWRRAKQVYHSSRPKKPAQPKAV